MAKALETRSSPADHSINIDKPAPGADTARMVSLLVHAALGLTVIGWIVASNSEVFTRPSIGPLLTPLECLYYVVGIASIALGWYFNIRFVRDYSTGSDNAIWGPGSWSDYIRLMFTNPAASSASQDYAIANVVLLPLFTIVSPSSRGTDAACGDRGCISYPACSPVSPLRSRSTSPQWNGSAGMHNAALIRRDGP